MPVEPFEIVRHIDGAHNKGVKCLEMWTPRETSAVDIFASIIKNQFRVSSIIKHWFALMDTVSFQVLLPLVRWNGQLWKSKHCVIDHTWQYPGDVTRRQLLVSGCYDGTIKVWDLPNMSCLFSVHHHSDAVRNQPNEWPKVHSLNTAKKSQHNFKMWSFNYRYGALRLQDVI